MSHDRNWMEDEAMRLAAIAYHREPFDEQCFLDAMRSLARRGLSSGKEVGYSNDGLWNGVALCGNTGEFQEF
jgi:hypothetical protein